MSRGLEALAILQQIVKESIPHDQRSDELQTNMNHAERIITNHIPYQGSIDIDFIEEVFQEDTYIMKHIKNQGLRDRLGMEFMYEMYPDDEFDKGRGKKINETKQDITERYGALIREHIRRVIEK